EHLPLALGQARLFLVDLSPRRSGRAPSLLRQRRPLLRQLPPYALQRPALGQQLLLRGLELVLRRRHLAELLASLRRARARGEPDPEQEAPMAHCPRPLAYRNYTISANGCPASRAWPSVAISRATVPSRGARSSFSIFIASTTSSGAPARTVS